MEWTEAAEAAIRKVPFFVRAKVRARVEAETAAAGRHRVTLEEVEASRRRFVSGMSREVKGYQVDGCFAAGGCPNRIGDATRLLERIEAVLQEADLLSFLKYTVDGPLKFHHEFRVSLAECPNSCSQVQVKDIGILAASPPQITDAPCTACGACVEDCPDDAVRLDDPGSPRIDPALCLRCGRCIAACPTGTLAGGQTGYRVQLGGKLGRHPRLARELPGIYGEDDVIDIVRACVALYKEKSRGGRRFADVLDDRDFENLARRFAPDFSGKRGNKSCWQGF
ncbi:MAG: 4Fe-4S dicluster domain-containing protein [Desulfobacteraceae bacterium]|jgi:dissimilatory sulfite reductase (desulfoviridin) alpha/beta subunit|nr:4Fe-4S dicluster domain-containing protein [Desulfobacteraceae bacterium]